MAEPEWVPRVASRYPSGGRRESLHISESRADIWLRGGIFLMELPQRGRIQASLFPHKSPNEGVLTTS